MLWLWKRAGRRMTFTYKPLLIILDDVYIPNKYNNVFRSLCCLIPFFRALVRLSEDANEIYDLSRGERDGLRYQSHQQTGSPPRSPGDEGAPGWPGCWQEVGFMY